MNRVLRQNFALNTSRSVAESEYKSNSLRDEAENGLRSSSAPVMTERLGSFSHFKRAIAIAAAALPVVVMITTASAASPVVMTSTYLDGGGYQYGWDKSWACATDASGNVYVAGDTQEPGFPTTANAFQKTYGAGGQDGFVTKFDRNGNLLWSTFLGGSGWDGVFNVTVDAAGNAVVVGVTQSTDFPVTANAVQSTLPAGSAAFVTVISADGTSILYSTYLGGSTSDGAPVPINPFHVLPPSDVEVVGVGVAVGKDGSLYVVGGTNAIDMPVTSGAAQPIIGGESDGFVARIRKDKAGTAGLIYLTYLGGALSDFCSSVAVDGAGNAFVTGEAQSLNFPTTLGAYQRVHTPGTAAFVTKLTPDGSAFTYSTLVSGTQGSSAASGNNYTAGSAITIDSDGHAYVDGETNDTDFPTTTGVVQPAAGGHNDGFVTEISRDGSSLVFSTYLGGSDYDGLFGIKLDKTGNIFVDGYSSSHDLPQVNAFQTGFGGYIDCWVAELSPGGTQLLLSSWFGGSDQELAYGLDLWNGQLYFSGTTVSTNFPIAGCAAETTYNGASGDVFFTLVHLPVNPIQVSGIASRKIHGNSGIFDIDLTSRNGVECRSGGMNGDYTLVFKFGNPLSSIGCAEVTSGTGSVVDTMIDSNDPHNCVVNLTGVTNAQRIAGTLSNVTDSVGNFSNAIFAQMGVLVGDVNASGHVDAGDIGVIQQYNSQTANSTNFRADVNVSGHIDAGDIGLTQSYNSTGLPSPP
jgi:hypothetical protein